MAKDKESAAPAEEKKVEAVKPSGVWLNAARGDVYTDAGGSEHVIHGVVTEGFDSVCNGQPENFRLFSHAVTQDDEGKDRHSAVPLANATIAAVNAWKKKG